MKNAIVASVLLLVCASGGVAVANPGATSPPMSTVVLVITDEVGAVIPRAFTLFRADALERENPTPFRLELRTDSTGHAEASLPPGFYDVFVAATGFAPHCQKLRVRDGKPAKLTLVLKIDKVMSDEYGDRF